MEPVGAAVPSDGPSPVGRPVPSDGPSPVPSEVPFEVPFEMPFEMPFQVPGRVPCQVIVKPIGPVCNLRCEYCFYLAKTELFGPGERYRMTDAVLEEYTRQAIESQPESLGGRDVSFLWQGGEPTLMGLDFFRRAVEVQRRLLPDGRGAANALQTNGTLLDDEWAGFLREHGFLVGISIDGPAALHDRFRRDAGGRPTHAAVMRGLRLLQRHGVEHNVLCTVHAGNAPHPLDVYRFLRGEGVEWIQFIPIVEPVAGVPGASGVSGASGGSGASGVSDRSVGGEAFGEFLVGVFDEWIRRDVGEVFVPMFEDSLRVWSGLPPTMCVFAETCGRNLAMEHDGSVYACDHYVDPAHRRGSITETHLGALAAQPVQVAFGAAKADGLPAVCRSCDVGFMCRGGCPKDRIATAPDGEGGLNHLCAGYRRFFRHADPYLRRMAALLRAGTHPSAVMAEVTAADAARRRAAGRNDPCPCGSGRKYKHCCLPRGFGVDNPE